MISKLSGTIQVPPKMLGMMGKWITSNLAVKVLSELKEIPQKDRNDFWEKIQVLWGKRNFFKLQRLEKDRVFILNLNGWRYSSKIDISKIYDFYPNGIIVSFSYSGDNGTWDDDKGEIEINESPKDILKFENLISQGRFERASNFMEGILKTQLSILYHEATHMTQAFLELGIKGKIQEVGDIRKPVPGLPSQRAMTPTLTQHMINWKEKDLREGEAHSLDDVEFYTRLRDEIRKFNAEYRGIKGQQRKDAIFRWVGAKLLVKSRDKPTPFANASKWFLTLKKHAPLKWKKAVIEFTKSVI